MFIGNKKIINLLDKSIKNGKISQAYLFSGPESVGKFTIAKFFSERLINSTDTSLLYSNEVSAGLDSKKDLLDLIIIEPEKEEKRGIEKEKDIKIEKIREAQEFLLTYPMQGKYKILIVNNAHRMTEAAQNSLLKVLEEPNNTSIIILVTHDPERILPTIKSRCQKIIFFLSSGEEINEGLREKGKKFDSSILSLAMGRPGKAIELLENDQQLEIQRGFLKELEKIPKYSLNEKLALAGAMSKNISEAKKKIELWIWILRKKALEKKGAECRNIFDSIEDLEEAKFEITRTNASSRLILENLLIDLEQ